MRPSLRWSAMSTFPSDAEIQGPLLDFLQDALGPSAYIEPPIAMTPGNDTQVYAFRLTEPREPLVLRVFRVGDDPRRPVFEATLQNALADQGLPVPRARAVSPDPSILGGPFFVMDRVPGSPLYDDAIHLDPSGVPQIAWRAMLKQGVEMLFDIPRLLADVALQTHALDAAPIVAALDRAGVAASEITLEGRLRSLRERVDSCALDGLRAGLAWLEDNRPEVKSRNVICHCDLQPLNLVLSDGKLRGILDWANASIGPPELEIAWSRATYLTLDMPLPKAMKFLDRAVAGFLASRITRAYGRVQPLDRRAVAYYEVLRSMIGLSILAERRARKEEIRDAWNTETAIRRTCEHVKRRSGADVSIRWEK